MNPAKAVKWLTRLFYPGHNHKMWMLANPRKSQTTCHTMFVVRIPGK